VLIRGFTDPRERKLLDCQISVLTSVARGAKPSDIARSTGHPSLPAGTEGRTELDPYWVRSNVIHLDFDAKGGAVERFEKQPSESRRVQYQAFKMKRFVNEGALPSPLFFHSTRSVASQDRLHIAVNGNHTEDQQRPLLAAL
jgi:hypothetical protein